MATNSKIKREVFHTLLWDRQGDEAEQRYVTVRYSGYNTVEVESDFRVNYSQAELASKLLIHSIIIQA